MHTNTTMTLFILKIITFIIKLKSILTNLKIPGTVFCSSPFKKLKKAYLRISKYLAQFFCSSPFSNIKKSILMNLKIPLFMLIIILKETIYIKAIIQTIPIKTIIQIDKHKVENIITACIPKLL